MEGFSWSKVVLNVIIFLFYIFLGHIFERRANSKIWTEVQYRTRKSQNYIFNGLLFNERCFLLDLQLRPYRTDDYLPKLYYETSRFTAFNNQWVVKSYVNDNKKDPNLSAKRSLTYQVVLKSKINAPIRLHFVALKGPYGDISVNPAIHEFEFSNENTETGFKELPIPLTADCNKLLAAKTINMRLIMFQVSKWWRHNVRWWSPVVFD